MSAALESTPRIELLAAETRRGETWENQASGRALDRMGGALGFSGAPELIKAARGGNAAAAKSVSLWFDRLALGIASIISVLDPQLVLLTGGVSREGDWFIDNLRRRVASMTSPSTADVNIQLSRFDTRAVAYGALISAKGGE